MVPFRMPPQLPLAADFEENPNLKVLIQIIVLKEKEEGLLEVEMIIEENTPTEKEIGKELDLPLL
jgi:hypothetical protein